MAKFKTFFYSTFYSYSIGSPLCRSTSSRIAITLLMLCATTTWSQTPGGSGEATRYSSSGIGGTALPSNPTATTANNPDSGSFMGNWRTPGEAGTTIPATSLPANPLLSPRVGANNGIPAATLSPSNPTGTSSSGAGSAPGSPPFGGAAATSLPIRGPATTPKRPIAKITNGNGALPNDRGQIWREYDISPFTARGTQNSSRPEQAIVEWILRETGYEAWHSEPLGLLSADSKRLRVYHTPQMQELISEIVDRFVNPETEQQAFSLRVLTVGSPSWRTSVARVLRPVPVQTQGVQAWLLSKEDAAVLSAELKKRNDIREHSAPQMLVFNGQGGNVANVRQRNYVRNITLKPETWPGFEPEMAQLQEGFAVDIHPLVAIDSQTVDAVVKCNIDQIERMVPVTLDVPTQVNPRQKQQIEVPQLISARLHEKFRWPLDQVLLISMGVVASPTATDSNPLKVPFVGNTSGRADLLLLVESRGKVSKPPVVPLTTSIPLTPSVPGIKTPANPSAASPPAPANFGRMPK